MKHLIYFLTILSLATGALACGNEKACTTSSDCGGGSNFCSNGTCMSSPGSTSSPGAQVMFEGEDETPANPEAEAPEAAGDSVPDEIR